MRSFNLGEIRVDVLNHSRVSGDNFRVPSPGYVAHAFEFEVYTSAGEPLNLYPDHEPKNRNTIYWVGKANTGADFRRRFWPSLTQHLAKELTAKETGKPKRRLSATDFSALRARLMLAAPANYADMTREDAGQALSGAVTVQASEIPSGTIANIDADLGGYSDSTAVAYGSAIFVARSYFGSRFHGVARFPLTSIPLCFVNDVDLQVNISSETVESGEDVYVRPYNQDGLANPEADEPGTVYSRAVDSVGPLLATIVGNGTGSKTVDLGDSAVTLVENATRTVDRFSVGFEAQTTFDADEFVSIQDHNDADPPTLIIDYTEITDPVIASVAPETFAGGESVQLDGFVFLDPQGTGKVELGDNSVYASASKQVQTIFSWHDEQIIITADLGALAEGPLWLFVTNDDGDTSAGYPVTVSAAPPPPELAPAEADIWVIIYQSNSPVGSITRILEGATIEDNINQLSLLQFSVLEDDESAGSIDIGTELGFWRTGEGEIFRGKVTRKESAQSDGKPVLLVSVSDYGIELQKKQSLGITVNNETAEDAANLILAEAENTWLLNQIGAGFHNISDRYNFESLYQSLTRQAEQQNASTRVRPLSRTFEMVTIPNDCGFPLLNPDIVSPSLGAEFGILGNLKSEVYEDVVNRIYPRGLNNGNIVFDIGDSDRSSPYTINSLIKNRPSITAVLSADNLSPINSDPGVDPLPPIEVVGENTMVVLFMGINTGTRIAQVSIGGVAAHRLSDRFNGAGGVHLDTWYAIGVSGRASIAITLQNGSVSTVNAVVAVALQDVDQRTPIRASSSSNSTSSTPTTPSISTGAMDLALAGFRISSSGAISSHGADQTSEANFSYPGAGTSRIAVDSKLGTGSAFTMSLTLGLSAEVQRQILSIQPAITYYIEDATSIANHGLSEAILTVEASTLVGAESFQIVNAANTLYDLAATKLDRSKEPTVIREWEIAYIPYSPKDWYVGDSVRTIFSRSGKYINETRYFVSRKQTFTQRIRQWEVTLSNIPVLPKTRDDLLTEAMAAIQNLSSKG